MEGPDGVSHWNDANKPPATARIPIKPAKNAMDSGVRDNGRAVAAGIISSEMISKAPTTFIETAITVASSSVKVS